MTIEAPGHVLVIGIALAAAAALSVLAIAGGPAALAGGASALAASGRLALSRRLLPLPARVRFDQTGCCTQLLGGASRALEPLGGSFRTRDCVVLSLRDGEGRRLCGIVPKRRQPPDEWRRLMVLWRAGAVRMVRR